MSKFNLVVYILTAKSGQRFVKSFINSVSMINKEVIKIRAKLVMG